MHTSILGEYLAQADAYQISAERMRRIVMTALRRQRGLMVIMEDVHDPHNLAAIARSCDAFGVQQMAFTLQDETLFDPQQVGRIASASASKWLDYRIFETGSRHALTTLKSEGWHILATWVSPQAQPIYDMDFTRYDKLALLVGNEHAGISPTAIELADSTMMIPMVGMIRSFNVSVAAAISLYEITRQRQQSSKDYSLPENEARALVEDFLRRQ